MQNFFYKDIYSTPKFYQYEKVNVFISVINSYWSDIYYVVRKSSSTSVTGPTTHFIAGAGYASADQSLEVLTPLKFGIAAIAGDGKLKRFFVQLIFKGGTITQKDSAFSSTSFNYDLHATAQGSDGTETWVFTIFDNNGGSAAVTLMITTTITSGPIFTYFTKVLGT